ncbi:MCE family protein [Speluncibacter jeojiensis]|uniref:MCE family protein n=1 Tax=Speluncibacter jeojiensis TaxID=2710754 RepID=UPI00240F2783|nr:MCE family protein [Rhodococcus sp. D2-41]
MSSPRRRRPRPNAVKFTVFVVCMLVVNAALVAVFHPFHGGGRDEYTAVFVDVSGLRAGDKVRLAGVPVGSVGSVEMDRRHRVHVRFAVDKGQPLTTTTRAVVRYQNLVGDRYLELQQGDTVGTPLADGATLGPDRTVPALNLDALLGGFRPLFQALDSDQINRLTSSLLTIFQGQGGTVAELLRRIGSVTSTLADRDQVIGQVIDNLDTALGTISAKGDQFDATLTTLQQLVSGLAADRGILGQAVTSIDGATASFAGLLTATRPDIAGTLGQLDASLTPVVNHRDEFDGLLQRMPGNYRKLVRTGAYGSFFNFYLCGLQIKVTGADGRPVTANLIDQKTGRCAWPR